MRRIVKFIESIDRKVEEYATKQSSYGKRFTIGFLFGTVDVVIAGITMLVILSITKLLGWIYHFI
jgi:hypothetical protein